MKMNLRNLLLRRRPAAVGSVVASCLLVAGCGSSSPGPSAKATGAKTTSAKTSTTGSTTTTPAPPPSGAVLTTGLVKAMGRNQRQLTNVRPRCPSGRIARYPVTCHFTATEVVKKFKKTYHMVGTITVSGSSGGSYEYGLNYAPAH